MHEPPGLRSCPLCLALIKGMLGELCSVSPPLTSLEQVESRAPSFVIMGLCLKNKVLLISSLLTLNTLVPPGD